ncbi:hypothetical protein ON010_g513 [Phytophthora cinnamomi]|nr:hypothetical protein ON010_g513 [Phytophthora cinnamomi]
MKWTRFCVESETGICGARAKLRSSGLESGVADPRLVPQRSSRQEPPEGLQAREHTRPLDAVRASSDSGITHSGSGIPRFLTWDSSIRVCDFWKTRHLKTAEWRAQYDGAITVLRNLGWWWYFANRRVNSGREHSCVFVITAMQPSGIPLPEQLRVHLTVKTGDPLTACRDKLPPIDFLFQVSSSYGGLRGTVEEMFTRQLPNVWRSEFELYLEPSNPATQRDFSVLQEGENDFKFVREHGISAGPAAQRYMSVRQARLPDEAPVQTPDDTTFHPLQWIDGQDAAMLTDQERVHV